MHIVSSRLCLFAVCLAEIGRLIVTVLRTSVIICKLTLYSNVITATAWTVYTNENSTFWQLL